MEEVAKGRGRGCKSGQPDVQAFVVGRVTHRCRVFEHEQSHECDARWLMRLPMDACLIALIKIHAARRDIGLSRQAGGWRTTGNGGWQRGRTRKHVYSNAAGVRFAKGNGTALSARTRLRASKPEREKNKKKERREERGETGAFVGPSARSFGSLSAAASGGRFFSPENRIDQLRYCSPVFKKKKKKSGKRELQCFPLVVFTCKSCRTTDPTSPR